MSGDKVLMPLRDFERRKAEAACKADRYISKDGGPPSPEIERALGELVEMSPAEVRAAARRHRRESRHVAEVPRRRIRRTPQGGEDQQQ